jgi:HEPN domain-containing protein
MAGPEDLAAELLARAADDEAALRALLDVKSVTDSIVGFHAQQAVEKSLKAALASREADFPFSHDLGRLMRLCDSADLSLGGKAPRERRRADRCCGPPRAPRLPSGSRRAVKPFTCGPGRATDRGLGETPA